MRRRPAAPDDPAPSRLRAALPELTVAAAAFLLVVADLDTGAFDRLPDGPGLTVDESFNVQQGVRLEIGLREWLAGRATLREVFGTADELGPNPRLGEHLPDHPPLGRLVLGVAHQVVTTFAWPEGWEFPFVYAAARFGSAAAFAATAFLVGRFATRRYGRPAGPVAAVSLILMPRVFGHAHLASLETMIGLFYAATVLRLADTLAASRIDEPPPISRLAVAGALFGLTLLTKVQAVLLPIPIAAVFLWQWRSRAIVPLAAFGLAGAAVFFAGWPWLWFDPVGHVREYLGRTTDRVSLPVWYLGRTFADRDVPWHYPFVLFAVTVPTGLHALGLVGTFAGSPPGWKDPATRLVLACLAFPLLVFAAPGVAVYDGERLFLVSFPLWAVLIGKGGGVIFDRLAQWRSLAVDADRGREAEGWPSLGFRVALALALFLAAQSYGLLASRPAYLSYYNALVGGLGGAERLGFEPTYWGDAVTSDLLASAAEAVPEGGTLAVAPVLHQFQLADLATQSPALRGVRLVEYGTREANAAAALLVFHRKASLPEELRQRIATVEPLAVVRRQGVTLAAVYGLPSEP